MYSGYSVYRDSPLLVQSLSCVQLFATPWTAAPQAPFNISQSLLKFMSVELVRLSHHLILCCPLLLLPSVFPNIRIFVNESTLCIRWPKYWSFSFRISPSNEYSRFISFRIDWFDLLAVWGTLKSSLAPQFENIWGKNRGYKTLLCLKQAGISGDFTNNFKIVNKYSTDMFSTLWARM